MADSPYVFDATASNFAHLVLENSAKGPVLVNFWSPRAGPCLMLMPRLVRLAGEFGGQFLLAMLNTDELGTLAREQGVVSLPTVKAYRNGRVVDTLHGAESDEVLREFIRRQLGDPTAARLQRVLGAHAQGDTAGAMRLAAEAALANPGDTRVPLALTKVLVLQGRYAQADDLLRSLPPAARAVPELGRLATHVAFLRAAQDAPPAANLEQTVAADPDNLEARYRLSAVHLVANDYEAAMLQLLEIVRRDRGFREDAGYQGLQALIELLGDDDERARRYRALLQAAVH
jgi:putative thioredoxin